MYSIVTPVGHEPCDTLYNHKPFVRPITRTGFQNKIFLKFSLHKPSTTQTKIYTHTINYDTINFVHPINTFLCPPGSTVDTSRTSADSITTSRSTLRSCLRLVSCQLSL